MDGEFLAKAELTKGTPDHSWDMMPKSAVDTMACSERLKVAKGTFTRLGIDSECTEPCRKLECGLYRRELETQGIPELTCILKLLQKSG